MKCYRGLVLLCLVAGCTLLPAASVPNYTFQNIQPPGTSGGATALNNLGDVLILANDDTYLFHRGRYTLIRTALGNAAYGLGVNARGTVVGLAANDDSGGFVRTKSGEFLTFQFPAEKFPTGINDRGDIVGAGSGRSFIRYVNGAVETFQYQNEASYAYAINNRRQTAVQIWKPFWTDSYIRDPDGTFTYINIPGSTDTQVFGINDFGDTAGLVAREDGIHGFVRHWYGEVSILDFPGARATYAWGINDWGQVAGVALGVNNTEYVAFLATPDWQVRGGSRYLKSKAVRVKKR